MRTADSVFCLLLAVTCTVVLLMPLSGAARSFGEELTVGYHYDAKHTVGVSGHSQRFFYLRRVIRSTCLGEFHG